MCVRVVLNPRLTINEMQGYNPAPGALDGAIRHRWPGLIPLENTDGFDLRGGECDPTTAHKLGLVPDGKFFIARQGVRRYDDACVAFSLVPRSIKASPPVSVMLAVPAVEVVNPLVRVPSLKSSPTMKDVGPVIGGIAGRGISVVQIVSAVRSWRP